MKRTNLNSLFSYKVQFLQLILFIFGGLVSCDGDTSTLVDSVRINNVDSSADAGSGETDQIQTQESSDEISEPEMISGSHLVTVICESEISDEEESRSVFCRYSLDEGQEKLDPSLMDQVRIEFRDSSGNLLESSAFTMTVQPADSRWSVRIDVLDKNLTNWQLSFYQSKEIENPSAVVTSFSEQEIFGTALTQPADQVDPPLVDSSPPEMVISSTFETTVIGQGGQLMASWNPVKDVGLGVSHYLVSAGSEPGLQDLIAWTNTSLSTTWSGVITGIKFNHEYFFNIKAVDFARNESEVYTGKMTFNYNLVSVFGSSMLLWLDATDPMGNQGATQPTDFELMTTWVDKSVGKFDFAPSPGADAPQYLQTGIAGMPAFHFGQTAGEGPSKMMKNDTIDIRQGASPVLSSISVYIKKSNSSPEIWSGTQNGFDKRRHSMGEATLNSPIVDIHEFRYDPVQNNTTLLVTHNKNPVVYYNALSFENDPTRLVAAGMALGCRLYSWADYSGTYFGDFLLGELILINRVLTSEESDQLWYYLSTKWGIPFSGQ